MAPLAVLPSKSIQEIWLCKKSRQPKKIQKRPKRSKNPAILLTAPLAVLIEIHTRNTAMQKKIAYQPL